ncbi:MAG: carbamate kinase [Deltaproteobacteria bacterium]|nr:MAG: carbamate kinase [Deltaproteobacteria bacterium]
MVNDTNISNPKKPVLLVALGGNALIRKGQGGTIEEQFENLRIPVRQIAKLSLDYTVIITHGNGPQVGNLLMQQECCDAVPKLPLEILVAQTEGHLGYMIESTLDEELMALGIEFRPLVTLITYVVVDKNDPAFQHPTKPIGPTFTMEEAAKLPYPTIKTSRGYRRVVASPRPITIIEKREIKKLIEMDFIVICCGGGGIPVIREGRGFTGVDAVVDKDFASSILAKEVGVDIFIIATDVQGAMLNFGTTRQTLLRKITLGQVSDYIKQGHFQSGSMLPKVEAAAQFISEGGKRAAITSIEGIEKAVEGEGGTQFVK